MLHITCAISISVRALFRSSAVFSRRSSHRLRYHTKSPVTAEGTPESSGKRRIKEVPQLLGLLEGSEIDLADYGLDEDSPADDLAERLDDMGLNAAIRNMIVSVLNQRDD